MATSTPSPEKRMSVVRRAIWAGESAAWVTRELVALARTTSPGEDAWRFAHQELALASAASHPWQASVIARRLLGEFPFDPVGWAALGLAQTVLGNCWYAIRCYERTLSISADQPNVAHNLGHLYDVVADDPHRAVALLRRAHKGRPRCRATAASLAQALLRTGSSREARTILDPHLGPELSADEVRLLRAIELAELVESEQVHANLPLEVPETDPPF